MSDKVKDGIDIAVMSDLHNKQYGKENKKLIRALDGIKPHVIMVAGDMLTAKPGKGYEKAAWFMERVAEKYPIYYGLGNHEYRMKIYPENYGDEFWEYIAKRDGDAIRVQYDGAKGLAYAVPVFDDAGIVVDLKM